MSKSVAMLVFTSLAVLGAVLLSAYDEKKVMGDIQKKD